MKEKIFKYLNIEIFHALRGGYTIIETMIAVSLFLVIIMAGMGAILNANLLHQKSRDMRSIIDNLSFIMEDMSRNLRTGYDYHCIDDGNLNITTPNSCEGGGAGVSFVSGQDTDSQWVYYIDTNPIDSSTYSIFKKVGEEAAVQLSLNEIAIDPLSSFVVVGAEPPPDEVQPFVTINLIGEINYKNIVSPFSLQTSVSQRAIDL